MSGSIFALSALVDDQVNVVLWPRSIDVGDADRVTVGGGGRPPSIPPPSGIRIAGTAESDEVPFPNLSPSGANSDSSSVRRNRRPRKSLRKSRIHPGHVEPLRERQRRLVEVFPGEEQSVQRIVSLLVAQSQLDPGFGIRFEKRQSRSDGSRFLHEQSELLPQLGRLDADFDPRLGVPVGQESTDRGRIGLDLDPTPPNGS